jgi:hypothetical protein
MNTLIALLTVSGLAFFFSGIVMICMLLSTMRGSSIAFRYAISSLCGAALSKFALAVFAVQHLLSNRLDVVRLLETTALADVLLSLGLVVMLVMMRCRQLRKEPDQYYPCFIKDKRVPGSFIKDRRRPGVTA